MKNLSALRSRLAAALVEDGAFSDITTAALTALKQKPLQAFLLCKAPGVFCGGFLADEVFSLLDRRARVTRVTRDGATIVKGQKLLHIEARPEALLGGERVFLNLVSHLCGVATLTRRFVSAVKGSRVRILETRKTTPLWRDLEKYAVRCGGGMNHRMSLSDAILVKDNHWQMAQEAGLSMEEAFGPRSVVRRQGKGIAFVGIEATNLSQVWQAIKAQADIILLDNMPPNRLKEAILFITASRRALKSDRPQIEVSGGVDLAKARALAVLGVDRISVGALTHSAPALDISLEVR